MKKQIKSIVILVCICLSVSFLLALTNQMTAPIIQKNQDAAANKALLEVMPNGGSFEELELGSYKLPSTVTEAYKASNGGYVITLTTSGYSSGMVIMCGVTADGRVSGAVCLGSSETLGYEKTYGESFTGKNADEVALVDTVAGATKTTEAYREAVTDALKAAIVLGGGSVETRTEEEILQDNLSAALPSANGAFKKHFFMEEVAGVNAIYVAENGTGYVCVIGEQFIGTDASGATLTACDATTAATATEAITKIKATTTEELDLADYQGIDGFPKDHLISAKLTSDGNYVLKIKGAGYGIQGEYHASGKYMIILLSMTGEGKIIDCYTEEQSETKNLGSACADEAFYGQFDGKTEENYREIDAISGATVTTNGYLKAIERAFAAVKILEGGLGE